MSKKDLTTRDQYQMEKNASLKLGDKSKAYKHIVEVETPNARNAEAAGKLSLRLVDQWERWEQSATKLAEKTRDPEVWRKVKNLQMASRGICRKGHKTCK